MRGESGTLSAGVVAGAGGALAEGPPPLAPARGASWPRNCSPMILHRFARRRRSRERASVEAASAGVFISWTADAIDEARHRLGPRRGGVDGAGAGMADSVRVARSPD